MFSRLLDFLFPPRSDEAMLRTIREDDFLALLSPTLVPYTNPHTVALLPFRDPRVRAAIHEVKYRNNEKARALLASVLSEYLREVSQEESFGKIKIVPVPLGKERLRERGYNQVEELVKLVERELSIPLEKDLLVRKRETVSQVSLPRLLRQENMRGAFTCLPARQGATQSADPTLTYILIDDVTTTGVTLSAAIEALRSAGATNILPIALAH